MSSPSLEKQIKKVAFKWTILAGLSTLAVSFFLFFLLTFNDSEQALVAQAESIVSAHRVDILSGDTRGIELRLNKEFSILPNEKVLFLDANKNPWVADLKEKSLTFCEKQKGACRNYSQNKLTMDLPIFFDSNGSSLWGYLHIERHPRSNWPLILSIILTIFVGMALQSFGLYYNIIGSIKSVCSTIKNWATNLSKNPKNYSNYVSAPFSEMQSIESALAGLNNEIEQLENNARNQGAIITLRGIGHDILNPVSRMKRIVGLLKLDGVNDTAELLRTLEGNIKRLSDYAEQIKLLHKKKIGEKTSYKISSMDISKELHLIASEFLYDPEIVEKNIKINTEIEKSCFANVPSPVLSRIVENLIGNSIHASNPNSTIQLKAERKQNDVVISVQDHGSGIESNLLEKVFEANFTTKTNKGTGLGLFVIKEMCDQFNGKVSIVSKVNVGTTVQVSFPLAEVN